MQCNRVGYLVTGIEVVVWSCAPLALGLLKDTAVFPWLLGVNRWPCEGIYRRVALPRATPPPYSPFNPKSKKPLRRSTFQALLSF